jgi:transcriptional regulator with XRE-family HTH domain
MTTTVVRSLREGTDLPQNRAAERVGLTPGTLAAYELGHVSPSRAKIWEIARALALGSPSKGERNPRFLITFALLGQRFVADGDGRVLVFKDPWLAHEQAERLVDAGFLEVAIVPVWRSRRRALVARVDAVGEARGEELADPLADLLEYASRLAADFDRFQRAQAPRRSGP